MSSSGESSTQTKSYPKQVKDTLSNVEKLLQENTELEKQKAELDKQKAELEKQKAELEKRKESNCNKIDSMIKKLMEEGEECLRVRSMSSLMGNDNIPSTEGHQPGEVMTSSAAVDDENNTQPCTMRVATRKRMLDISEEVISTNSKQKRISAPNDVSQNVACASQSVVNAILPTDIFLTPNIGGEQSMSNSRPGEIENGAGSGRLDLNGSCMVDLNNAGRRKGDLKKTRSGSGLLNKTCSGGVDVNNMNMGSCRVALINTGFRVGLNKTSSSYEVDLNKSVVECNNIVKKSVIKEMEAMTPVMVKPEVDLAKFECNFCNKSFSSAAPLASHVASHHPRSIKLIDCPFQLCEFQGNDRNLTKHMRSKHTDEMLFSCSVCAKRFCTMTAKSEHEAKHYKSELVWCGECSRFNKVEHGGCKKCQ